MTKCNKWIRKPFLLLFCMIVIFSFYPGKQDANQVSAHKESMHDSPRQMEKLDRGLVAIKTADGVFISWRMLGTDRTNISFNLYRNGKKINQSPIKKSTNFLDSEGTANDTYMIEPIEKGKKQPRSEAVTVWSDASYNVPLQKPQGGTTKDGVEYAYQANDASVGDIDGDGKYEIIHKWDPTNSKDNSHTGFTGNVYIDAYELDGTHLWRIDLGKNIRAGAHYTQFMVYDLDGDGKSEIAMKTADGSVDGTGAIIGDANADYRNEEGRIITGPEYLTIFDGQTGKALETTNYSPARGDICDWGDCYGNRGDRFLAGIAYLDGTKPSLIMARGYYEKTMLTAYNYRNGKLEKQWTFDSDEPSNEGYASQGNHNLSIADVDDDNKDEIIYGSMAIDDNGTGLYTTGLGHGDAMHVGDLDPERSGLEVFQVHESYPNEAGMEFRDADSGELIWGIPTDYDVGRGLSGDIDPRFKGEESWAVDGAWNSTTGGLYTSKGDKISTAIPPANFSIWWDGDLSRELLDHRWNEDQSVGVGTIAKWDYENSKTRTLLTADGTYSNNGTKGNPSLQADIIGDWREEAVWRTEDSEALTIYTTTALTNHRIYTLMHDPVYRLGIAWQNVAYNQPPHTSFYLGNDMQNPPPPSIYVVD
ncbi:rhamnogalacturonan exolyase YesX [Virgibacillus kapii]|uniref:Rhamnogalacturonan exolyase YesX n=2 Tax=Bacillaceae TaxID=186817 RepID=A0ABQ2DGE4_9BACI|nr:rhamnogalacturonan exolyase YesX [Virgibacillus kapii]